MEQYKEDRQKLEIADVKSDIRVLAQKVDTIENNHLAHIKKDIDRILYILSAVGIVILGELFVLLNKVL
jgi:Mg2+ and Co2+ transporter CorA